jgi:hypothetical protein
MFCATSAHNAKDVDECVECGGVPQEDQTQLQRLIGLPHLRRGGRASKITQASSSDPKPWRACLADRWINQFT